MSARNIASLGAPIRLHQGDYGALVGQHRFPAGHRIVVFLAPPWADALNAATGLDLSRTKPPIREIIADFEKVYAASPIMYVVARTPGARPTRSAARRLRMVGAERLRLGRADRPPWRLARNSPLAGVASRWRGDGLRLRRDVARGGL